MNSVVLNAAFVSVLGRRPRAVPRVSLPLSVVPVVLDIGLPSRIRVALGRAVCSTRTRIGVGSQVPLGLTPMHVCWPTRAAFRAVMPRACAAAPALPFPEGQVVTHPEMLSGMSSRPTGRMLHFASILSYRTVPVRGPGECGHRVRRKKEHHMAEYLIYFNQQWV